MNHRNSLSESFLTTVSSISVCRFIYEFSLRLLPYEPGRAAKTIGGGVTALFKYIKSLVNITVDFLQSTRG